MFTFKCKHATPANIHTEVMWSFLNNNDDDDVDVDDDDDDDDDNNKNNNNNSNNCEEAP